MEFTESRRDLIDLGENDKNGRINGKKIMLHNPTGWENEIQDRLCCKKMTLKWKRRTEMREETAK